MHGALGRNSDSTVSVKSASLYSLYTAVANLHSSIVKDTFGSNNDDERDLRLVAGDVVKKVEKLVPSGSNSFSEWVKSTDNEN